MSDNGETSGGERQRQRDEQLRQQSIESQIPGGERQPDQLRQQSIGTQATGGRGVRLPFKREYTPYEEFEDLLQVDLTNLDRTLLKSSHARLGTLKSDNYHIWAQAHRRFLRGRGMWGIVAGTISVPTSSNERRNWMILDQWIATLLAGDVEDSQQGHIAHLIRSQDIWDELRRIHGVSGKGRLAIMLQRFYGYTKSANESIDKMSSVLKQLSDEIFDLAPEARPSEISRAAVIMNACEGEQYAMAKYTLGQADVLTPALAVEQLRSVEQDTNFKDSANVAKGNRGKQGRRPFDKSKVECYGCHEFGHFKSECPNGNGNEGQGDNNSPPKDRKASDKPATKPPVPGRRDKAAVVNESEGNEITPSERVWMARYNEKTSSK